MDRFKHSVSATDIGTSGSSYAALQLCRFIGNDIAIQIRQDEYVEIAVDLIVNQVGCHDIYIPVVGLDLRVILGNIVAEAEEFASVFFMIFALVTMETFLFPLFFAYSKAAFASLVVPIVVVTLKSMEISSLISTPRLPSAYSPSVFSL